MWEIWAKVVAKGFKNLPKVQKIAQSGHTVCGPQKFSAVAGRKFENNICLKILIKNWEKFCKNCSAWYAFLQMFAQ